MFFFTQQRGESRQTYKDLESKHFSLSQCCSVIAFWIAASIHFAPSVVVIVVVIVVNVVVVVVVL